MVTSQQNMKERKHSNVNFATMNMHKRETCDATFTQKHGMIDDIATVHEGKISFKCEICHAEFGENQT